MRNSMSMKKIISIVMSAILLISVAGVTGGLADGETEQTQIMSESASPTPSCEPGKETEAAAMSSPVGDVPHAPTPVAEITVLPAAAKTAAEEGTPGPSETEGMGAGTTVLPSAEPTGETATPLPPIEPIEDADTPLPSEEPTEETTVIPDATTEPPEAATDQVQPAEEAENTEPIEIQLKWHISAEDGRLCVGDEITLNATVEPKPEDIRLQWQVATKPAKELKESEEEWKDIADRKDFNNQFIIQEEMQSWRWRLVVIDIDNNETISEEKKLPASIEEARLPQEIEQPPENSNEPITELTDDPIIEEILLPRADVTFTANVPADEITFGTEITLTAHIENSCEGMQTQWQYFDADAQVWADVADATRLEYRFILTEENCIYLWRLLVTVPQKLVSD